MVINKTKTLFAIALASILCFPNPQYFAPKPSISTTRLASKVIKSVVGIHVSLKKGGAVGSGVIISPDGYVVTCAHVVGHEGMTNLTVITYDGDPETGIPVAATVVVIDRQNDLAILKLAGNNKYLHYSNLGDSSKVRIGDTVLAAGFPLNIPWTITKGIVSGLRPSQGFIQIDASINPGNSGGPLFNEYGEVIGINARIACVVPFLPISSGVGFAIESNRIRPLLYFLNLEA
jgi:S1-C subfamily serine protease